MKREEKPLLSICISSYNKGNRCSKLIHDILTVDDDRLDIVVSDDCSSVETVKKIKTITDGRVKLFFNEENIGPCRNWYETIDRGTGRYILHVLDRDDINIVGLRFLLDILQEIDVGGGYIGSTGAAILQPVIRENGMPYVFLESGYDAVLALSGILFHPTGFLIKKTVWNSSFKEYFYESERYGIYPHTYVMNEIAASHPMIYVPADFVSYNYVGETARSRFYQNITVKDKWWEPESFEKDEDRIIKHMFHYVDENKRNEIALRKFDVGIYRATLGYEQTIGDEAEMSHYGIEVKNVNKSELLVRSKRFYEFYSELMKDLEINIADGLLLKWRDNQELIEQHYRTGISLVKKYERMIRLSAIWARRLIEGKSIGKYLRRHNLNKAIIYGYSVFGHLLYDELKKEGISVTMIIDRNADHLIADRRIMKPSEIDDNKGADVMIVTSINADNVKNQFEDLIRCPIIGIEELLLINE